MSALSRRSLFGFLPGLAAASTVIPAVAAEPPYVVLCFPEGRLRMSETSARRWLDDPAFQSRFDGHVYYVSPR